MQAWTARIKPGTVIEVEKNSGIPDKAYTEPLTVFGGTEKEALQNAVVVFKEARGVLVIEEQLCVTRQLPGKAFSGRVKSIEFDTGKVSIANKEKDFFYVRGRDIGQLCTIVLASPYQYATFELDGRIVESFKAYKGAGL